MCSSEDCEKLWFFDKRSEVDYLYKLEGEPKGVSIEQFLDEPSGKPSAASSRAYPFKCSTNGSVIERNGLCRLKLSVVMKVLSQRTSLTRRKSAHPQKELKSQRKEVQGAV